MPPHPGLRASGGPAGVCQPGKDCALCPQSRAQDSPEGVSERSGWTNRSRHSHGRQEAGTGGHTCACGRDGVCAAGCEQQGRLSMRAASWSPLPRGGKAAREPAVVHHGYSKALRKAGGQVTASTRCRTGTAQAKARQGTCHPHEMTRTFTEAAPLSSFQSDKPWAE